MKKLFIFLFTVFFSNITFSSDQHSMSSVNNAPLLSGPSGYLLRTEALKNNSTEPLKLKTLKEPTSHGTKHYAPEKSADTCNLQAMLALPNAAALVQYLQQNTYSCLSFLWNYDPAMIALYNTANVTAVYQAITNAATTYSGDDSNHLLELLSFIRIGYYQNDYHSGFTELVATQPQFIQPLTAFFQNAHVFDNGDVQGSILGEAINAADAAGLDNELYEIAYVRTLVAMLPNLAARLNYYSQEMALYYTEYAVWRSTPYIVKTIPSSMIDILTQYAEQYQYHPDYDFIFYNPMSILTNISTLPDYKTAAILALEHVYNTIPAYTVPWIWAIQAMFFYSPCVTLSTGAQLCLTDTQTAFKNHLFNQTFSYENGQTIFYTGSSLHQGDIDPLYYATKEIKAQFGRIIGNLTPVTNDTNQTMHFYIFSAPGDFSDFLQFIFGPPLNTYETDGKYNEQSAAYYTFQRTSSQSIYSLQEMIRNGYSRYLVGRYLVPGINPTDPLFSYGRTVFYDEGMAEFLAGSTLTKDVQMRADIVTQLKNDGTPLLPIAEIVSANYWNNSNFKRYAGMFFHFLYTKHLDMFQNMNNVLAANDSAGFDNLIFDLIFNTALNLEYQTYLNTAIGQLSQLYNPTSTAPTASNLIYNTASQIQTILTNANNVTNMLCNTIATQPNPVFGCQGEISGSSTTTKDSLAAWYAMNQLLDQFQINVLQKNQMTNVDWMSCRFNAIQWKTNNSQFIPFSTISCEGPLGS